MLVAETQRKLDMYSMSTTIEGLVRKVVMVEIQLNILMILYSYYGIRTL